MQLIPSWIRHYPQQHLGNDVLAGVTVAILVIPQSLAYALLAGLPAQAGLIASIAPVLAYAWLGSSQTQAVGPVAITAIMTSAVLAPMAVPGTSAYTVLAALLALMSGLLMATFGLLRLGFLAQLLSRPVVAGFISGSAVLIVLSQLRHLLGLSAQTAETPSQWVGAVHGATLVIGATAMAALVVARQWLVTGLVRLGQAPAAAARLARMAPLVVLAAATAWVVGTDADHVQGVAVVGAVDLGGALWAPVWPQWDQVRQLAGPALTLAFIGAVQGITMAQALAVKRREALDVNQELLGLGAANMVAACSGGMPVGGGTSRTAINTAAGAQTPLASVVTALCMVLLLLLGTSWMERMPIAALAASIVVAALGMVDLQSLRQAWLYDRADAAAYLGTALGVWGLGLELGIALGIGLSLATLLLRASTPHIAVVGRVAGTEHFRNVERHGVETIAGVLFLRVDESLFFGNLHAVQARLYQELARQGSVRDVVLLMSAVNRVDTTAMEVLADWNRDLQSKGARLHLAEVKGPVQDRLECVPLWQELSGEVFLSVNTAFEQLRFPKDLGRYEKRSVSRNEFEGWEVI
ncbi:sulfate permease [Curvibacter sp. APW13]|uniref:SulP family inorganic anion transporter n=1 Tax=Curvibacter sp. APW13 TaxID=3077236 RepID=UPI0028E0300D|nr:sulfate permease [Curvibacter sp. APW13]MDT8992187.1 sulfate permease [Curvibacter sp. APW13]